MHTLNCTTEHVTNFFDDCVFQQVQDARSPTSSSPAEARTYAHQPAETSTPYSSSTSHVRTHPDCVSKKLKKMNTTDAICTFNWNCWRIPVVVIRCSYIDVQINDDTFLCAFDKRSYFGRHLTLVLLQMWLTERKISERTSVSQINKRYENILQPGWH